MTFSHRIIPEKKLIPTTPPSPHFEKIKCYDAFFAPRRASQAVPSSPRTFSRGAMLPWRWRNASLGRWQGHEEASCNSWRLTTENSGETLAPGPPRVSENNEKTRKRRRKQE